MPGQGHDWVTRRYPDLVRSREYAVARGAWCPPWLAVLAALLVGVWLTIDLVMAGPWHRLDLAVADSLGRLDLRHTAVVDRLLWLLTLTGARGVILVAVGALALAIVYDRRSWQPILRLATAFVLLTVTVYAFKLGLGRTAPGYGASLLHAGGMSYPSGHTANAVLWWGLALWLARDFGQPEWIVRGLRVLAVGAPVVASVAMLLLDYHWLTDVLMGIAVGVILLRVLHLIFATGLGDWAGGAGRGGGVGSGRRPHLVAGPGLRG